MLGQSLFLIMIKKCILAFLLCFLQIYFNNCIYAENVSILKNNPDLKILRNFLKNGSGNDVNVSHSLKDTSSILPFTLQELNSTDILDTDIPNINNNINATRTWHFKNFFLFTRDYRNGSIYELLDPRNISTVKYCHFQTRSTYVIIHGFIGNGLEPWVITLKDKLLAREDCNVISVDWPAGTSWFLPTYAEAAHIVPFIGNDTTELLNSLIAYKGLLLKDIHCIGHSLGGHVCGFAGKPFKGRFGRISGLDPAGPLFHKVNASERLDKKDAIYVDVMHTNACDKWPYWTDCYGLNENVGHSDFFPNGGLHQPGCFSDFSLGGEIGCSHERAYVYFIASLDFGADTTFFLARPCENWDQYMIGNCSCGKAPQFMGINVNTELDGEFYLETLPIIPFAMEDPDCSDKKPWNFLIIIGYALIALLSLSCMLFTMFLAVQNVQRSCCSQNQNTNDNEPLVDDSKRVIGSTD